VNNEPEVSLKILELARSLHPTATNNVHFLKLITRILIRLGDVRQLRWVYQLALGSSSSAQSSASSDPSLSALTLQPIRKQVNGLTLDEQYALWKDYLNAELTLGMSDVNRLNQLRDRIRALRTVFDESKLKAPSYDHLTFASADMFNLYEPVLDIFCRYDTSFSTYLTQSLFLSISFFVSLSLSLSLSVCLCLTHSLSGQVRKDSLLPPRI
jgi:hypothetical protein